MLSESAKARWSCALYFLLPGLCYSLLTCRMPAIKDGAHVDELQIGTALFVFGMASVVGLSGSSAAVRLIGHRLVLAVSAALTTAALIWIGGCESFSALIAGFCLAGFGIGMLDSQMNAQGMFFERKYKFRSMNIFHAFYSLGAIFGSIAASVGAGLDVSPLVNFLLIALPGGVACILVNRCLIEQEIKKINKDSSGTESPRLVIPLILIIIGLLCLLGYAIEGSVGEWGSLFLVNSKDADPSVAALVYGIFSATVFAVRIFGDKLRNSIDDYILLPINFVIAFIGMAIVLLSENAYVALLGYVIIGFGLATVVPTLFSLGGKCRNISPTNASSIIAIFAYSGLLVIPPSIGWLASHFSLEKALYLVLVLCILGFILTFALRSQKQKIEN